MDKNDARVLDEATMESVEKVLEEQKNKYLAWALKKLMLTEATVKEVSRMKIGKFPYVFKVEDAASRLIMDCNDSSLTVGPVEESDFEKLWVHLVIGDAVKVVTKNAKTKIWPNAVRILRMSDADWKMVEVRIEADGKIRLGVTVNDGVMSEPVEWIEMDPKLLVQCRELNETLVFQDIAAGRAPAQKMLCKFEALDELGEFEISMAHWKKESLMLMRAKMKQQIRPTEETEESEQTGKGEMEKVEGVKVLEMETREYVFVQDVQDLV